MIDVLVQNCSTYYYLYELKICFKFNLKQVRKFNIYLKI